MAHLGSFVLSSGPLEVVTRCWDLLRALLFVIEEVVFFWGDVNVPEDEDLTTISTCFSCQFCFLSEFH